MAFFFANMLRSPVIFQFRQWCFWFRLFYAGALLLTSSIAQTVTVGQQVYPPWNLYWKPFSLNMVNGNPAAVWVNEGSTTIYYARALDPLGAAWGSPVGIQSGSSLVPVAMEVCLRTVNGKPAVCYFDFSRNQLAFLRATDADGSAWGQPVMINTPGTSALRLTMEVVDGNPAIAFSAEDATGLRYVRATDTNGGGWGTVKVLDGSSACYTPVMRIVEGQPAVAYSRTSDVRFLRAADATGNTWNPPVTVFPERCPFLSMEEVNGRPAIAGSRVHTQSGGLLWYARAGNESGTGVWDLTTIEPDGLGFESTNFSYVSLAQVNGKAALAYVRDSPVYDVFFTSALNGAGTAWGSSLNVETRGDVGKAVSLMAVQGRPAVAYLDTSHHSLKFHRSSSDSNMWIPELRVEQPVNNDVPPGAERFFGGVNTGERASLEFTLRHISQGSGPIGIESLTIDGRDAAEFFVAGPLSTHTLTDGSSVNFIVRHAPVSAGRKTAVLHITMNAEGAVSTHDVALLALSMPEIAVHRPAGSKIPPGGTHGLPDTLPGNARDFTFTVRNDGMAPLDGLAVTLSGPDSDEFTVTSPPAESIPHGGSTEFTLRHVPVRTGQKNAMVSVANNLASLTGNAAYPGSPYQFSVRTARGAADVSFNPLFSEDVQAMALTGNGGILVSSIRSPLTSLKPDGSVDPAFFPPTVDLFDEEDQTPGSRKINATRPEEGITCIAVQNDGKILIGGGFARVDGLPRPGLARLEPDGTLDESFLPASSRRVTCIAIQRDGKILVANDAFGQTSAAELLRLRPDGSLDSTFAPLRNHVVSCLAVQPDGKILAATRQGNLAFYNLLRLDPDGTPHEVASFDAPVRCLALQPDGKILAGGEFVNRLRRLNPDGTDDALPVLTNGFVCTLSLQTNGAWLAGWLREAPNAANGFAKLTRDGLQDALFAANTTNGVRLSALQADGKALIAGDFILSGGFSPPRFARLENDPAATELRVEGRSTVRWLRSGSASEISDVVFHARTSGSPEWKLLGFGNRIAGGWELKGLKLAPGILRAQGRAGGSLFESLTPIPSPLDTWRLQYFNTTNNTGPAADDADPDLDGLTNFTEFAFGLNPTDRTSNALPEFKFANNSFTATFTATEGREDLLYTAESSPSMESGTWTIIPDTGTSPAHRFTLPAAADRLFTRFTVQIR